MMNEERLLSLEERLADAEKRIAYLERCQYPIPPGFLPSPVFPVNPDPYQELKITCGTDSKDLSLKIT